MGWVLTKGLQNLRSQINERWPNRDHASDGTIGDTAHQKETSGHNRDDTSGSRPAWNGDSDSTAEVRAFDCDTDFREPGVTAQMVVDHIRRLPAVSSVLRYMIYNRKMYHERDGFSATTYTGPSAHTEHIHFEGAWTQAADNNTSFDYRLGEVGDIVQQADIDKIVAAVEAKLGARLDAAASAWDDMFGRDENRESAGTRLAEMKSDIAEIKAAVVTPPAAKPTVR